MQSDSTRLVFAIRQLHGGHASMTNQTGRMSLVESLRVLQTVRQDEIVVPVMGAAREWMKLGTHPLDFVLVPSSMGQGTALGLGMAIAQPERGVIVCNGDGSLLMNLGSLVSITAAAPSNLTLLVFDNGVYEVTGSQRTPASALSRKDDDDLDYTAIARACGFRSVFAFDDIEQWRAEVHNVIGAAGPTFALLKVDYDPQAAGPRPPAPNKQRARDFRAALKNGNATSS